MYEVLNRIALKQNMWSQTFAYISKSYVDKKGLNRA